MPDQPFAFQLITEEANVVSMGPAWVLCMGPWLLFYKLLECDEQGIERAEFWCAGFQRPVGRPNAFASWDAHINDTSNF